MELYLQETHPFLILTREIPSRASTWSGDEKALEGIAWPFIDKSLFARFYQKYRSIVISSGHPHGDYGQTVSLWSPGQFTEPDVTNIANNIQVPDHLVSENLPFKPSAMTGWYRYQKEKEGDTRHDESINRRIYTPRVVERFFFAYQPGYQPSSFADLGSPLGALRYLSTIMHELNEFDVALLETGIYIKLRAKVVEGAKPPFLMGS